MSDEQTARVLRRAQDLRRGRSTERDGIGVARARFLESGDERDAGDFLNELFKQQGRKESEL